MDSSTSTGPRLVPPFSSFNLIIRDRETHAQQVVRSRVGFSAFAALLLLLLSPCLKSSALAQTPQPVTINFDGLTTGTVVTNQYSQVKFSAMGFSAGPGGPNGWDLFTQNNAGLGSSPFNAIRGRYNPYYSPFSCSAGSNVYLDFPVPVKNLSFLMLNMYPNYAGYHITFTFLTRQDLWMFT
jgi:hypothetical protein